VIHDINGIIFSPGERDKNAVATAVAEPGLYFVEFNAAVAYQGDAGAELAVGQWLRLHQMSLARRRLAWKSQADGRTGRANQ